jgi:hypothetical protein
MPPRAPARARRRDERSQRHCPHRKPGNGTDHNNQIAPRVPGSRSPRRTSSGSQAGRLKDASGAAMRPGIPPGP